MSVLDSIVEGTSFAIVIRPGHTFSRPFWLRTADDADRVPLDGWGGAAQIRDEQDRLMIALVVAVSQETDITDPDCGLIDVSATASVTRAMSQPGLWDLTLTRGSGPTFETRDLIVRSDALLGAAVTRL